MNRITTLLLSHPEEFMNLVNSIEGVGGLVPFAHVDEFVYQMLKDDKTKKKSVHQYNFYVLYDKDVGGGYIETASSIISSDINPLSTEGLNSIINTLSKETNNKKIVIRNIIILEEPK